MKFSHAVGPITLTIRLCLWKWVKSLSGCGVIGPITSDIGSAVVAMIVGCYYNVIIAWTLFYLYKSMQSTLPWSDCPNEIIVNVSVPIAECAKSSETSYFWYREALNISESIADFDGIRGSMLLSLALAWVIVYLIIMKGMGKPMMEFFIGLNKI